VLTRRLRATNFDVQVQDDPPVHTYIVTSEGRTASFKLNGVWFGELHGNIQQNYVANVRKEMLLHGCKLHGPTLTHYLKQVGR
jgi:hypothetical protein